MFLTFKERVRGLTWKAQIPVTVAVSLAVFALQAIHSILLARLLGPEARGEYGTAIFFSQTMIYIGLLGTHYSIARLASSQDSDSHDVHRTAFRSAMITGVLSMVIAATLYVTALPTSKQYLLPFCLLTTLLLPAEHLRIAAQAVDHGRGKFNRYNLSRLFAATIFPVIVLFLYLANVPSLFIVAAAAVFVSWIGYLFYIAISDAQGVWHPPNTSPWKAIRMGLPDGGLVLAHDLYDRLAIWLVIWMASNAEQGLFQTAFPIATLLVVAPNAIELFAFRAAANPQRHIGTLERLRSCAWVLLIQIVIAAALLVVLEPLIMFLLGEQFRASLPIARVLILGLAFGGLTIVGEGYLRGIGVAKLAIYLRAVAVGSMLIAALSLTHQETTLRIATAVLIGHIINASLVGVAVLLIDREPEHAEASK